MKQILFVIASWTIVVLFVNYVALEYISQHNLNGLWALLIVVILGDGVILASDLKAANCQIEKLSALDESATFTHEMLQSLHTIQMKLDNEAKSSRGIKRYIYETENRHRLSRESQTN
jgi:hypothetical protein